MDFRLLGTVIDTVFVVELGVFAGSFIAGGTWTLLEF